jgi:hypothetical protein
MDRKRPDLSPPLPLGATWTWSPKGESWVRIFHRDFITPTATLCREYGPLRRFDHHFPSDDGGPSYNAERSIIYLAKTIRTAAAETFADFSSHPVCPRWRLAHIQPTASIEVQDISGPGAMALGTRPWMGSGPILPKDSQAWARRLYDERRNLGGIRYTSSKEGGACLAIWDRAPELEVVKDGGVRCEAALVDPETWEALTSVYKETGQSLEKIEIGPADCVYCRDAEEACKAVEKNQAARRAAEAGIASTPAA